MVVWSLQYQHDIDAVEAVQRRATRMDPELAVYEEMLSMYINTCMAFLPFCAICLIMTYMKA